MNEWDPSRCKIDQSSIFIKDDQTTGNLFIAILNPCHLEGSSSAEDIIKETCKECNLNYNMNPSSSPITKGGLGGFYWRPIQYTRSRMDLLILDMDGVLIDVSRSYRETIQRTVQIYLEKCLGFKKAKEELVTKEDISLFKSAGGFNNDWDLTSGLLLYLLSISSFPPSPRKRRFSSMVEVVSYLEKEFSRFPRNLNRLLRKKDISSFVKKVESLGGGLKGVRQGLKSSWDGWVYGDGDLNQEDVVRRIFQEVYLGEKFISCYHMTPLFYKKKGLYLRERMIIPRSILFSLKKKLRLGIASGRPRFEAELALNRFRLLPYFNSVVTLDECNEEEVRIFHATGKKVKFTKPHPYSLLRVVQEIGIPNPRCGYVGDVVDDMLAARAAKEKLDMLAIGFVSRGSKKNALKESLFRGGADWVVEKPHGLLRILSSK